MPARHGWVSGRETARRPNAPEASRLVIEDTFTRGASQRGVPQLPPVRESSSLQAAAPKPRPLEKYTSMAIARATGPAEPETGDRNAAEPASDWRWQVELGAPAADSPAEASPVERTMNVPPTPSYYPGAASASVPARAAEGGGNENGRPKSPTSADEPRPRHLRGDLPERAPAQARISLLVSIILAPSGGPSALLKDFPVGATGARVTITVSAVGLIPLGDLEQDLFVPLAADSEPIRFGFRTGRSGLHSVVISAFYGGTFIGELALQVSVEVGSALEPHPRPARRGAGPGRFPRSLRFARRRRSPALSLRPRHGYPTALHRGLPANRRRPAREFPARRRVRTAPGPYPPDLSRSNLQGRERRFLAYSFPSRSPGPRHLAVLAHPGLVRAAPALAGTTRTRLPSPPPSCSTGQAV